MIKWNIYHKDGSFVTDVNGEQVTVKELEYSGSWMGECFVTINFNHPSPINLEIGDYIMYRGERFELNYDPGKDKQARKDTYGEGFKYDSVKFSALQDEMSRSEFLDVVLHDNQLHYTALPKFSFYVDSVDDLLDRIQANLDEQIGEGKWKIFSRSLSRSMQRGCTEEEWKAVYGSEETSTGGFDSKSLVVESKTCWEALALVNTEWDINFIVRNRNVYVGTAGVMTQNIFKYGLGNGLYEVDQNADPDQSIITRLRAYGSEKNLPDHYYADLGSTPFLNVTGDYKPGSTDKGISVMLEDSVYDGMFTEVKSDNGSNMKHVLVSCEIDGYRFNAELELVLKQSPTCTTRLLVDNNKTVADAVKAKIDAGFKQVLFVSGAKVSKFNGNRVNYIQNLPNNMAISRLMLPGFPSMSLADFYDSLSESEKRYVNPSGRKHIFSTDKYRPYIDSVNIEKIGLRSASQFFDTDDKTNGVIEIYPTIEEMVVGGVRVDEVYTGSYIEDNGRFDDGQTVNNFDIYLSPAIDFDINSLRNDDFTVCMKDGMCGGRDFKVASASKISGTWRLTLERTKDDALNLYFPYNEYPIRTGDHFVLTGIELPDSYIRAASLKLLKYAIALLDKNDYTRYVYQPKVDEIFMARQHDQAMAAKTGAIKSLHDTLKEGDIMQFYDEDLGIDAKITIDQLTIKENEDGIPTYEVTLREDKEVGTIQKIQQQISSLSSGNGGSGSGSGLTMGQVASQIPSEGGKYFLSKLQDDTAQGIITFMNGLVAKDRIDAGKGLLLGDGSHSISENGDAVLGDVVVDRIHDAASTPADRVIIGAKGFDLYMGEDGKSHVYIDDLVVRQKFFASSAEIRKISYSGGTTVFSNAGSTLAKVSAVFDSHGECVAYKCYACADDGTNKTMNWWHVGMMALCQTFNVKAGKSENLQNRYYWRLVVGVGQETLEDGKLYDYVVLSNKKTFLGSDSYVPTYTDKVIADENDNILIFGGYGVEVTTDGGMGSMAGVFYEQEGKNTDDGGNLIANRVFYGYDDINGFEPDAPSAGDVIVQVGDQICWKSRGNVIKLSTSTEDNATGNAPSIAMYHNVGVLYSTGEKDGNGKDIVSPYQWKTCTCVISPEMELHNVKNFKWFTESPDKTFDPITVVYQIETTGMFRVGSDGKLTGDNVYSNNQDTRYVGTTCYQTMGTEKSVVNQCWWEVSYNALYITNQYEGSTSIVMANGDVEKAPAYISLRCYTLAISEDGTKSRGDVLLASVDVPVMRDGKKGDAGTTIEIVGTITTYAKTKDSTMPDKENDSLWSEKSPALAQGEWLWTRTAVYYSDLSVLYSVSVSRVAKDGVDGEDGTSVKITSTSVTYATTSTYKQPTSFPYASMPSAITLGWYLWTKTVVNYSDGQSTTTMSVSRIGDDGKQGTPGPNGKTTHFAYADSVSFGNGKVTEVVGFSTTLKSTSEYIGTYDDNNVNDSEDWSDYSWTKLKGEQGIPGNDGVGVKSADVMYCIGDSDSTAPADNADWKTLFTELTLANGKYVWTCTKVVYTKGNPTYSGKQCLGKCEDFATVTEQYALSTSSTDAPTSGWGTTYSPAMGKWLWTRSEIVWTDGSKTYTKAVCVSYFGKDGENGKNGDYTEYYFAISAYKSTLSPLVCPVDIDSWSATAIAPTTAKPYVWMRIAKFSNGSRVSTSYVRVSGEDGNDGKPGAYTVYDYKISVLNESDSPTIEPEPAACYPEEWQDEPMAVTKEYPYLWMRMTRKNDPNDSSVTYVCMTGEKGQNGQNGKDSVSYSVSFDMRKVQVGANTYEERIYVYVTKSVGTNTNTWFINNAGYDFDVFVDGEKETGLKSVLNVNGYIQRSAWPNASMFQINLYDENNLLVATNTFSYGQKGEDGDSGLEIVLSPTTLVYNTDDDGIVTDYSQSAIISCNKGGVRYTNVSYSVYGTLNCQATYSGGTIKIMSINKQTLTYTEGGETKTTQVSQSAGYVAMRVVDNATGLNYYPQLNFTVNVSKFTGQMVMNNKKFQTQFTEITNRVNDVEDAYNDIPLKNQDELTEYTSSIEQTARKISLSVGATVNGRRNLLVGSEFKRFDEENMTGQGQTAACRLRTGDRVDGYNSCRIVSESTAYQFNGVVFKKIQVDGNTKYTFTAMAKRLSDGFGSGCYAIISEFITKDDTLAYEQQSFYLLTMSDMKGTWYQKSHVFTTHNETRYVNVILCVSTNGSFAVCKPMFERGDTFSGYSLSEYDYEYVGGNLIDNSRFLNAGGTLLYVQDSVSLDLGSDYAIATATASGSSSRGVFAIKKTLKAGVDYILSWYIKRTGGDENGQCMVNFGRRILYSERWDGIQAVNSVEGGNTPYSGYQGISNIPTEWARFWIHFRLSEDWTDDDNVLYIQLYGGSSSLGYVTAQFSRPKLEEGAYPTEWTDKSVTMVDEGKFANQLLATGIDIVNKQVTVTSDNFKVRNNSGVETMMVNKDGTLNAAMIVAQRVQTLGSNGQRIVLDDGLFSVYGLAGMRNWQFGLDDQKRATLSYYDDYGNKLYDLGPEGISKVKITQGTFRSGDYVNAATIGLSVSSFNNVSTKQHTSTSATGEVSVTETIFSSIDDDTKIFVKLSTTKTLGAQFSKTTLYYYRAPRVNDVIQSDPDNKLNTQALAQQADGKYFFSQNICDGTSLQNLASGCFFNANAKVMDNSQFLLVGLGQFDSIKLAKYFIQAPISITLGAKSISVLGQIKSWEQYTQLGSAGSVVAPIEPIA